MSKLVRNRIPDIIRTATGSFPNLRYETNDGRKLQLLKDKLLEEAKEVFEATSDWDLCCELADLYEVMLAIGSLRGYSLGHIQNLAEVKRATNGSFSGYIVLEDDNK